MFDTILYAYKKEIYDKNQSANLPNKNEWIILIIAFIGDISFSMSFMYQKIKLGIVCLIIFIMTICMVWQIITKNIVLKKVMIKIVDRIKFTITIPTFVDKPVENKIKKYQEQELSKLRKFLRHYDIYDKRHIHWLIQKSQQKIDSIHQKRSFIIVPLFSAFLCPLAISLIGNIITIANDMRFVSNFLIFIVALIIIIFIVSLAIYPIAQDLNEKKTKWIETFANDLEYLLLKNFNENN